LAARVFGTEAVLSSGQAGWSDLFRRPAQPRDVPEPSAALLCLALMFPAYFLLTGGVAQLGLSPGGRLGLMVLANVALFGCFPLLSAWMGNVRLATAFRLTPPGVLACAGALLLGLTLWPFVHELILLLRSAGVATLRPEHLERVQEVLAQWR